jgi:hypothetical protein
MLRNYFYGYMEERIMKEPPEVEWITELLKDIKKRLMVIVPEHSEFNKNVDQSLDVELFEQMIKHNAMNKRDLLKISNYTFTKILELCNPFRDPDVEWRRRLLVEKLEDDTTSFKKCLSLFIHHANISLDEICDDIIAMEANCANETPNGMF